MKRTDMERLKSRKGVALAFVALLLFIFLGMGALAVDLAFLYGARSEAQRVADAAALAGAGVLLQTMDSATAHQAAMDWGNRNRVRGEGVMILEGDVDVIPDSQKVRVRVHRTQDRETAVQTIFARALGFRSASIRTVAAAQAYPGDAIDGSCLLPFALPDRWLESDGTWPDFYDEFEPPEDTYIPHPDRNATGYSYPESVGYQLQVRGQQPSGADYSPGWWRHVWFWGTQVPGNNEVDAATAGCYSDELVPVRMDDHYQVQPGGLSGPRANDAFQSIINKDSDAYWEEGPPANPEADGCNCIKGSEYGKDGDGTGSPRIRPIALFDPRDPAGSGASDPVRITNFINVFIESTEMTPAPGGAAQPTIMVRFLGLAAISSAEEWRPDGGPLSRIIRLVE